MVGIALKNSLRNAWKYTGKVASPQIVFESFKRESEMIYFVRDNGAGFDPKKADMLFIPFKRLHSERDFPSTGIGLAIVERVVKRHGGKIWAEGETGLGATFYFTLGQALL
jgi:light-regulated signal transduction histidine kinase (bacteriophytochrome)